MSRVAIVGTCPSSNMLAPFDDPTWDIWACGPDNAQRLPRVTVWFELHADLGWENPPVWEQPYINWLNDASFTLYAQRTDLFPRAGDFPWRVLVKKFGPYWFTSSIAWMMGLAILQNVSEIGIWGADMSARNEYRHQKPGVMRLIEIAHQNAIPVFVPPESDLLRPPPLYGYSVGTLRGQKWAVRERELLKRVTDARVRKDQIEHEINHLVGSLDQLDYDINTWTNDHTVGD